MSLVDQAATSTLPKLLQRNAEQDPKGPGIREKTRGVWQTLTWTGYRDQMRDLALGLAAIGFKRGDKLSVVGDNRPQLYIAQLSAQVAGRHLGAGLSGFDRLGAGLRAEPRRDVDHHRRGPGAGRQGAVAQGQAAEAALDHLRRSARPVVL